jgi:hypothetical protein
MTNFNIENLQGKGITAEVINGGAQYSSYGKFADAAGHPDAVEQGTSFLVSARSIEGDVVQVLAKGLHGNRGQNPVIYVCMTKNGEKFLIGERGVKLMEPAQLDQFTTDALLKEIERRAFEAGFKEGEKKALQTPVGTPIASMSAPVQTARDTVVAQAKEDVEKLVQHGKVLDYDFVSQGNDTCRSHFYAVDFQVNGKKRAVTAIVRRTDGQGNPPRLQTVKHVAVAKCEPNDCFNEFIGKAIALYRALGIEVPDELLNAPQPEGKQSGDIASDGVRELRLIDVKEKYIFDETAHLGSIFAKNARVINDTARYN